MYDHRNRQKKRRQVSQKIISVLLRLKYVLKNTPQYFIKSLTLN